MFYYLTWQDGKLKVNNFLTLEELLNQRSEMGKGNFKKSRVEITLLETLECQITYFKKSNSNEKLKGEMMCSHRSSPIVSG